MTYSGKEAFLILMRRLLFFFLFVLGLSASPLVRAGGDMTFGLVTGRIWGEDSGECSFLKWEKFQWEKPGEVLIFPNARLVLGKLEAESARVLLEQGNSTGTPPEKKSIKAIFISLYEKNEKEPLSLEEFKTLYESARADLDATLGEKGNMSVGEKRFVLWKSVGSEIALLLGLKRTDKGMEPEYLRILSTPSGKMSHMIKEIYSADSNES